MEIGVFFARNKGQPHNTTNNYLLTSDIQTQKYVMAIIATSALL